MTTVRENKLNFSTIENESWYLDFMIKFENDGFNYAANKSLFAINSDYFRQQLKISKKEVIIKNGKNVDDKYRTLQLITDYFKNGTMDLDDQSLINVIKFSQLIEHQKIIDYCCLYMQKTLNDNNYAKRWSIFEDFNLKEACEYIEKYILRNFQNIYNNGRYMDMDVNLLLKILSSDKLQVDNEEVVFNMVKNWILYDIIERNQYFKNLSCLITLSCLTEQYKKENVEPFFELMKKRQKCGETEKMCRKSKVAFIKQLEENFDEQYKKENFLYLTFDDLKTLMNSDKLKVNSQETLFNALEKWIEMDKENRIKYFTTLISNVKFSLMSSKFLFYALKRLFCEDSLEIKSMLIQKLRSLLYEIQGKTLLIVGGQSIEKARKIQVYNKYKKLWIDFYQINMIVNKFSSVILDDELYILGGDTDGIITNKAWTINLKTKEMKQLPSMNHPRHHFTATVFQDYIYVIGGTNKSGYLKSIEMWDTQKTIWKMLSPMKVHRRSHATILYNEKLYVFGGYYNDNSLNSLEIYSIREDKWSTGPPMLEKRSDISVAVLNGLIYVFGGHIDYITYNNVQVYDPKTEKWRYSINMPVALQGPAAVNFEDKIFVTGGSHSNAVYEFDDKTEKWENTSTLIEANFNHNVLIVPQHLIE